MKHWFKFRIERTPGEVLDCIELNGLNRTSAEKILRSKYPNIHDICNFAWGDTRPSWYK